MMNVIIYELEAPNGKCYVGKTLTHTKGGKPKGLRGRWNQHLGCARRNDGKGCRLLNNAIRKYGARSFKKKVLLRTTEACAEFYEELCIKIRNTLVPNGYNLTTGGKHHRKSEETIQRHSEAMKKKLQSKEMRKKWSQAKLGKPHKQKKRKRDHDNSLPKYVLHYKCKHYEGYEVQCHPTLKSKKFTKSKLTMEEKLQLALDYLQT